MPDTPQNPNQDESPGNPIGDTEGGGIFLKPRLIGTRFEGHSIPLEFLKDLAVIEEMVIEVAKWKFLQANPKRTRAPKGFTDGVSLVLTGVDEGSAIPLISLVMTSTTLFPPENQGYFEKSRDAIVSAIGEAEAEAGQSSLILSHLPERALSYFNRIGQSLRVDEAMEFSGGVHKKPVRLTVETRRRLVFASSRAQNLTIETVIRGVVPEADQDAMTFHVQLPDGRKIPAPMAEPHTDTIIDAFNRFRDGYRIVLRGVGRTSRTGRLERVDSIEHMSVLDPLDVGARLDELHVLKDGWLDGLGCAPSAEGLDWLESWFEINIPDDLPLPYLFPTEDGGVRAEWSLKSIETSAEIDLENKTAEWHELDLATDNEESRDLVLTNADDCKWLADQIRKHSEGLA